MRLYKNKEKLSLKEHQLEQAQKVFKPVEEKFAEKFLLSTLLFRPDWLIYVLFMQKKNIYII